MPASYHQQVYVDIPAVVPPVPDLVAAGDNGAFTVSNCLVVAAAITHSGLRSAWCSGTGFRHRSSAGEAGAEDRLTQRDMMSGNLA